MTFFPLASPSFAVSRKFVDTVGGFFPNRNNSDYQWFIRAHVAGLKGVYDPRFRVHFCAGGYSNTAVQRVYIDAARTAVAFGGNPIRAWAHCAREMAIMAVRNLIAGLLPAPVFERLRKIIRKVRRIS